jgi:hypothetical protein
MRTPNTKRAIKNAFFRLGLHATPKGVVHALAQGGVQVEEELVRLVRYEMLKETTRKKAAEVSTPVTSPALRRYPKVFPRRDGRA